MYDQIRRNGGVLTPNQMRDLAKYGFIESAPQRGDLAFSELLQWPEFSKFTAPQIITALSEVLGKDKAELAKIRRTINENLTYGRQGKRVERNLRGIRKAGSTMTRTQIAQLAERLGLDAQEFEKWFDTAPFTPVE